MVSGTEVTKLSEIFYSTEMAWIASGVVGFMVLVYSVYNGFFYLFRPAQYKGIRFTTKNISYITLMSAVSVAVTIIVSVTFPITVFPPVRIAFEGLMVKITGYIFGPIVGLLSGVITDGLALLFVPSYVHIAYLIVIASFGFLSGCIGSFNRAIGTHKWIMMAFINVFIISFGLTACLLTYYSGLNGIELFKGSFVSRFVLTYTIAIAMGITLAVLWLVGVIYYFQPHGRKRWHEILPIIALAIVTEYWVTTLISSWGDIAFLTASQGGNNKGYGGTMIARLIMSPPKIIFNSAVIYISYRAVGPLIHKDN